MTTESAQHTLRIPHTHASLKQLGEELVHFIFTDFEAARQRLDVLEAALAPDTPSDIRLMYHLGKAFLENQYNHFDISLFHLKKALEIQETLADLTGIAETRVDMVAVLTNLENYQEAEKNLEQAAKYLNAKPEQAHLQARWLAREGYLLLKTKQEKSALAKLMESERLFLGLGENLSMKDAYFLSLVLSGQGEIFEYLNEKEKCIEAFLQVLQICEKYRLRPRLAYHFNNAGRVYLVADDIEEAAEYFKQVLRYAKDDETDLKAQALANIGIAEFLAENEEQALALFDQAIEMMGQPTKSSDFNNLAVAEGWKAKVFLATEQLAEAEKHFARALEYGEQGRDLNHLIRLCTAIADFKADAGDFETAFAYQKHAFDLSAKHTAFIRDRELSDLEARYDLEKRRQEARMAKLQQTGLQLRALRAQMNPHFLFNAMNAIQGLITSGNSDDAERYLAKFSKLMRRTLEYSDWEVVSLATEMEFLEHYLEINSKLRFSDKLTFDIEFDDDDDPENYQIPTMIVQPFIENAIEHGVRELDGGHITISFTLSDDQESLLCKVEDNGIGINASRIKKKNDDPQFQAHRSRGMEITKERLQLLHEQKQGSTEKFIRIVDIGEKSKGKRRGTRVEVTIPLILMDK